MKRINKKGFTLIELLAVVVILSIIALIAVPTIVSLIIDSKQGAAKDATYGVISAAETFYAQELRRTNGQVPITIDYEKDVKNLVKGRLPKTATIELINGEIGIRAEFYDTWDCTNISDDSEEPTLLEEVECTRKP